MIEHKKMICILAIIIVLGSFIIIVNNRRRYDNKVELDKNRNITVCNTVNGYDVYNSKNGKKITTLENEEEYKIKLYEIDPNYQEN